MWSVSQKFKNPRSAITSEAEAPSDSQIEEVIGSEVGNFFAPHPSPTPQRRSRPSCPHEDEGTRESGWSPALRRFGRGRRSLSGERRHASRRGFKRLIPRLDNIDGLNYFAGRVILHIRDLEEVLTSRRARQV
jgi:hypothetical protein